MKMTKPIVTVKQGQIQGTVGRLLDGSEYYSFKGIPYAQPPVGKLRFKAPLPPNPWSGILDASEHSPICPQIDFVTRNILDGDENCLFLNVYTRFLKLTSKIPVMVFIHGGAFVSGSGNSDEFGPDFLLQHDVMLVTINYRLEVFGFLCLDIPEVPGNAGLKDQVIALRWVKNNIEQFGGDPDNVTIFGGSAGGASVTYHMMSPMSKGLFHKAIAQSGVCITDGGFRPNAKEGALRLGKYLGREIENAHELLEYLQSLPAREFVGLTFKILTDEEKLKGLQLIFAPVAEKEFAHSNAFITERSIDVLLSGNVNKVPFMTGYNSAEGLSLIENDLEKIKAISDSPSYLMPRELCDKMSDIKAKQIDKYIKEFYFKDFAKDYFVPIMNLYSDIYIIYNAHRFLDLYAGIHNNTYMYRFDLDTELNIFKTKLGLGSQKGACHGDELCYLFKNAFNVGYSKDNEVLRGHIYAITKLWTDFAKTGNPTPDDKLKVKWTAYSKLSKEYLSIDETMSMRKDDEKERLEFWNKLYSDAGLPIISKST